MFYKRRMTTVKPRISKYFDYLGNISFVSMSKIIWDRSHFMQILSRPYMLLISLSDFKAVSDILISQFHIDRASRNS
jgi:hypothetical protein